MISEYIRAAMATAEFEPLEDAPEIYGRVPACQGVWATGSTLEACRQELESALEDWLVFRLSRSLPIPEVAGTTVTVPALA